MDRKATSECLEYNTCWEKAAGEKWPGTNLEREAIYQALGYLFFYFSCRLTFIAAQRGAIQVFISIVGKLRLRKGD